MFNDVARESPSFPSTIIHGANPLWVYVSLLKDPEVPLPEQLPSSPKGFSEIQNLANSRIHSSLKTLIWDAIIIS